MNGTGVLVMGDCNIHPSAAIGTGSVVGKPYRRLLDGSQDTQERTYVARDVELGCYVIVGAGAQIAEGCIIDDFCTVESRAALGLGTLLIYRAQVCCDATIGERCVIGGFIGERSRIAADCRVFGRLVHTQHNPTVPWDADQAEEQSPELESGAFVGFDAMIIGGVHIGRGAYVCAGATVTRDVPAGFIASGVNRIIPPADWTGRLRQAGFFNSQR